MAKISKRTAVVLFIVFFIAVAVILLWSPKHPESMSQTPAELTGSLRVDADKKSTSLFTYSGPAIIETMTVGCDVPAGLTLHVTSVESAGEVIIYVNDFLVGYADITSEGDALIISACECSTSCVCEVKTGENTLTLNSNGFAGEVTYELWVES